MSKPPLRAVTDVSEWEWWDSVRHKNGMVYVTIVVRCSHCDWKAEDYDTREVAWAALRGHVEAKHAKEAGFLD